MFIAQVPLFIACMRPKAKGDNQEAGVQLT